MNKATIKNIDTQWGCYHIKNESDSLTLGATGRPLSCSLSRAVGQK